MVGQAEVRAAPPQKSHLATSWGKAGETKTKTTQKACHAEGKMKINKNERYTYISSVSGLGFLAIISKLQSLQQCQQQPQQQDEAGAKQIEARQMV